MSDAMNIDKAMSAQVEAERPDWLEQWQQAGLETFRDTAWPTRKTEQWKYTPLKSLTGIEWSLAPEDRNAGAGVTFEDWDVIRLDIVNGIVQGNPDMPEGVSLIRLTDCDESQAKEFISAIDDSRNGFMFDAVNQALLKDGYWLKIEQGAQVDRPIHLNYIGSGRDVLASSQVWLDVSDMARVTVVETFTATDGAQVFNNANTAISVGENAQVMHYHLLLEEGEAHHVGRVSAELSRHAKLTSFHMGIGGVLKRKDIHIRHRGEGAELSLNGVYLPKGREVIDYHTCIEHEVPHCTSEQIFRGIIDDSAKAVFNGRIHIHKHAQKSLAEMSNRNLLMSDQAEIDTKPELEIYADDVKCAHGATIARLDDTQLFYFQTRGISRAEAEVMLSFGFINELLDALPDEPVQQLLRPVLATLFAQKKAELARHLL